MICTRLPSSANANGNPAGTSNLENYFNNSGLETPTLILSRSEVGKNYAALKKALPRVDIHYAVKPNNHRAIIDEVKLQGGAFDVCSAGDINVVRSAGVDPADMIHSHPVKSFHEFDAAVAAGVKVFVVDNPDEIEKLSRYEGQGLKILVRFRLAMEKTPVVNLQYKYGCTVDEVLPLARQIQQTGSEFYGLCFHIGSQCVYNENYVRAIEAAHSLINELDQAGLNVSLLDIGGGFPAQYIEPVPEIDEFCRPIAIALDNHIRPGIRIVSEPGRYISATSTTLVCSIIGKAVRDGRIWYYIDDGLYSTFSGQVYDNCSYPVIMQKTGATRRSVLAGPTCDSFDVMYDGIDMPEHNMGDKIMFGCTGAYCAVSGSNFNALKRPEYTVVD